MAFEFKLPDIGEGVVEGELTKWLVDVGQAVTEDTPLFEVLTDKVSAVIPSPRKGTVAKRHFGEGDMVPVGAIVVTIEEAAGAAPSAPAPAAAPAPASASAASAAPAPAPAAAPVAAAAPAAPVREPGERVRAAPATRKLARDLGVDLFAVAGSGEHGRVTKSDVEAMAGRIAAAPATPAAAPKPAVAATALVRGADEERVKLKGLRRKIYAKMRESKDHAAHFTYVDEVDFTAIIQLQDALAASGLKSTFLPFVVKAVVLSLQKPEFAYLNAQIDEAAGEIVLKKRYHIGIAAATDAGLVVPVVRDADQKSIRTLIDDIKYVGEGARKGSLPGEDMSGSTFTITSLGKLGGMFATPIINYPESAILGLHKCEKRPVVIDGQIVIRDRMYMSCSFDHRLIDGHVGAGFVQSVKGYLEQPALMLADLV
jgi:pyruvate dehydrogenase E2 component (dihydrolipoamide acetyltransferase)